MKMNHYTIKVGSQKSVNRLVIAMLPTLPQRHARVVSSLFLFMRQLIGSEGVAIDYGYNQLVLPIGPYYSEIILEKLCFVDPRESISCAVQKESPAYLHTLSILPKHAHSFPAVGSSGRGTGWRFSPDDIYEEDIEKALDRCTEKHKVSTRP